MANLTPKAPNPLEAQSHAGPRLTSDAPFNQAFLAALVESSEDAIVGEDPNGTIMTWNRGAEALYGYTVAEALGRPALMLVPPDRRAETEAVLTRLRAREHVRAGESQRQRKDGRLVAVSLTASIVERDGVIVGIATISRDITERQRADEQARAASQYARSLIEASLDPLVTISPEGKITDVNEATIKVTGMARERLIGTDFFDYFVDPEKAREGYQQVFAEGFVTNYPLTIRHRDGRLTDVLYNASVYKDSRGKVQGVFAAARDVTAQKQASQYARSLIEASLDPLVTISPEGKITDVNEASALVTGVAREKLIGTDFSDYFTEPQRAREGYQQVFSKGSVTDYPLTIRHRNGRQTNVLYNASVYKSVLGDVLGVFAAARDVTAQKQAEAEVAEQRGKELDRLAELERFQKLTVGRELKMIELKKEIEALRAQTPSREPGASCPRAT
jgi:PAS domain S-box-containing protein